MGVKGIGEKEGKFRELWTEGDGLRLHAMASTEPVPENRPPLVLVHGLGLSHRYMMPVARRLAPHFPTFVPDLPGFGWSDHPAGILDVPGLADGLQTWMDSVGMERASLLGNSFGCQIIADFAARYPERTDRIVLQGPTTPPGERTWLKQFIRWRQNSPFNPPGMDRVSWEEYRMSGYLRVLRTFNNSLRDPVEKKLPDITAPALVVRGTRDPICHQWWAEDVAYLLPNGRLVLIPDVAHTLVFTAPVQLAAVSCQFLQEDRGA